MINVRGSAKWRLTESSMHIVPSPLILNKESICNLNWDCREQTPSKGVKEGIN